MNDPPTWTARPLKQPHPICQLLRQLRHAAGLSLGQIEQRHGIASVVLGAYERGDREPPLSKIDKILSFYGYKLCALPADEATAVRIPEDMAAALRNIANQLEHQHDLPALPESAA